MNARKKENVLKFSTRLRKKQESPKRKFFVDLAEVFVYNGCTATVERLKREENQ